MVPLNGKDADTMLSGENLRRRFSLAEIRSATKNFNDELIIGRGQFGKEAKEVPFPCGEQLCRRFSLAEIRSATKNFKDELVIGQGQFGKVYMGKIDNGVLVAVKRFDSMSNQGASNSTMLGNLNSPERKTYPELWAEIERLSKLSHDHLVSLIGYCNERPEMILVYEYMSNGTLDGHLHKGGTDTPLSWTQRLKICLGVARGLDYLHTSTGTQHGVVHGDLKSSNILLDENLTAKISDFGLFNANQQNTSVTKAIVFKGTNGNLAPEYFMTGRLSRKSDVYAFGVVLLEVLCGRRALDTSLAKEQQVLAGWARECIRNGKLNHIVDSSLLGNISRKRASMFAHIANCCLYDLPNRRPTMGEVVTALEFVLASQERSNNRSMKTKELLASRLNSAPSDSKTSRNNKTDIGGGTQGKDLEALDFGHNPLTKRSSNTEDLKIFSLDELNGATQNFKKENLLGQGDVGCVYKGRVTEMTSMSSRSKLRVRKVVAVKRIYREKVVAFSKDRFPEETQLQLKRLGQYSHANIVKLLGYCLEEKEFFLVYEFMENGSLASHLFKGVAAEPLPWFTRLKVLLGAAQGLVFLHETMKVSSNKQFKPCNVLLDREFNSKIQYLGLELAHQFPVITPVHVTEDPYPYAPPETLRGDQYDMKSDVFVFGVVLLETLTGSRGWESKKKKLAEFGFDARIRTDEEVDRIYRWSMVESIDPRLEGKYPHKGAVLLSQLAHRCMQQVPQHRPSMEQVLSDLERVNEVENCNL